MSTRDVIDTLTSAGRRSHYERLGQLITDLTVRREADSRGAWHIVIVTSWQSGETVHPDLAAEFVTTSESRPFKAVAG